VTADVKFSPVSRADRVQGASQSEILHVAQSKHHDIAPGRSLGLTTVWVNRRHGKKGTGATLAAEAAPTLTVNSLADLVALHQSSEGAAASSINARAAR
jgi:2-haloacid dehalogenase